MGWHPLGRSGLTCQRKDCGKSPLSHSPKEWIPLKKNPLVSVPLFPLDRIAVPLSSMAPLAPAGAQLGRWAAQCLEHSNREATGKTHARPAVVVRMGCGCCAGGLLRGRPWQLFCLSAAKARAAALQGEAGCRTVPSYSHSSPSCSCSCSSVLQCVLAYGSLYFCFHTCLVLHSSTSPCSCPGLPAPPPSIASAVTLPLAALLSWCRGLLSILLAGRMSFHACQAALLLFKDADSGSRNPIGQS